MLFKMALKNVKGFGLRSYLNAFILSLVILTIIFLQGIYDGFQVQIERDRVAQETGVSQYWAKDYDPLKPYELRENQSVIPGEVENGFLQNKITPVYVASAIAYPQGKVRHVLIKGIRPEQKILDFPTGVLGGRHSGIPTLMGERMARSLGVEQGDMLTVKWRTHKGTIDTADVVVIVAALKTPAIDTGIMWMPLDKMQELWEAKNLATYLVSDRSGVLINEKDWHYKDENILLADTRKMIKSKSGGAMFLYVILLFIAGISILDTQLLSIFKRKKEIGLLLALGLNQKQIIILFLWEGLLQCFLAAGIAAIIGGPILIYLQKHGLSYIDLNQFGMPGGDAIYPFFSLKLITITMGVVAAMTLVASYVPVRKISNLMPSEAIRGKWL